MYATLIVVKTDSGYNKNGMGTKYFISYLTQ